jgi:hypothetical protein
VSFDLSEDTLSRRAHGVQHRLQASSGLQVILPIIVTAAPVTASRTRRKSAGPGVRQTSPARARPSRRWLAVGYPAHRTAPSASPEPSR